MKDDGHKNKLVAYATNPYYIHIREGSKWVDLVLTPKGWEEKGEKRGINKRISV